MFILTAGRVGLDAEGKGIYSVHAKINDREIWSGTVRGHDRSKGWTALLVDIALAAEEKTVQAPRRGRPRLKVSRTAVKLFRAQGLSWRAIAKRLGVSARTVRRTA
jgi:hypothetical protein